MRCISLPYNLVGLYMGAGDYAFSPYLLGSMLGLIPKMISFTLMGSSAPDFRSPVFLAAVGAELLMGVFAFLLYRRVILRKRENKA